MSFDTDGARRSRDGRLLQLVRVHCGYLVTAILFTQELSAALDEIAIGGWDVLEDADRILVKPATPQQMSNITAEVSVAALVRSSLPLDRKQWHGKIRGDIRTMITIANSRPATWTEAEHHIVPRLSSGEHQNFALWSSRDLHVLLAISTPTAYILPTRDTVLSWGQDVDRLSELAWKHMPDMPIVMRQSPCASVYLADGENAGAYVIRPDLAVGMIGPGVLSVLRTRGAVVVAPSTDATFIAPMPQHDGDVPRIMQTLASMATASQHTAVRPMPFRPMMWIPGIGIRSAPIDLI